MNQLLEPSYFEDVADEYDDARERYYAKRLEFIGLREEASKLEIEMKDIEADLVANQGTPDCPIDGKNAEMRDAQLRNLLAKHGRYRNLVDRLISVKTDMAVSEVDSDDFANRMSVAKRRMDRSIQEISLAAAVEANAGIKENRNGNPTR